MVMRPIAVELVPYLQAAIVTSPSELVFPRPDGRMLPRKVQLEQTLRRALRRAGIVTGHRHLCRRKGCGHAVLASDAKLRRCPKCNMKLWPVGQVRPLRFHHTRHTTASLLMMAGADLPAVQRIMRHTDPRITTEFYGHLSPGYLRNAIDRLVFNHRPAATTSQLTAAAAGSISGPSAPSTPPFAASVLHARESRTKATSDDPEIAPRFRSLPQSGRPDSNRRHPAPKFR